VQPGINSAVRLLVMDSGGKQVRWAILAIFVLPLFLSACGDTWSGAKEDTQDNINATKRAL
jgi:hypothetical protein